MTKATNNFKAIYESALLETMDPRKSLKIQVSENVKDSTVTLNVLSLFTSDKSENKGYVKAVAFTLTDAQFKALASALVEGQKVLTSEIKRGKSARAKAKSGDAKSLSGEEKYQALKAMGIDDAIVDAIRAKDLAETKAKEEPSDIFTQLMASTTKKSTKKSK